MRPSVVMVVLSFVEFLLLLMLMRLLLLFKLELGLIFFSLFSLIVVFHKMPFFIKFVLGDGDILFISLPSIKFGSVAFEAAQRRKDLRGPLPSFSFLD
jgi:hypothetical protein